MQIKQCGEVCSFERRKFTMEECEGGTSSGDQWLSVTGKKPNQKLYEPALKSIFSLFAVVV